MEQDLLLEREGTRAQPSRQAGVGDVNKERARVEHRRRAEAEEHCDEEDECGHHL